MAHLTDDSLFFPFEDFLNEFLFLQIVPGLFTLIPNLFLYHDLRRYSGMIVTRDLSNKWKSESIMLCARSGLCSVVVVAISLLLPKMPDIRS